MGNVSKREPANGAAVATPEENGFSLISNDKLIELYANLLKHRLVGSRRGGGVKRNGSARLRDSAAGTVGVVIDLGPADTVSAFPLALEFGRVSSWPMAHGASPSSGNGASNHPRTPASAGAATSNGASSGACNRVAMHMAIGAALASKTKNSGAVTVVFANDENRDWWLEAQQVANAHELPMIFVAPPATNKVRGHNPSRTSPVKGSGSNEGLSFPCITVDGHDVVAIYRVASEAIARARKGRGPTLINCQPFSFNGRNGSRSNGSAISDGQHDAVVNMERYLRGKGLFKPQLKREIIAGLKEELGSAVEPA